MCKFTHSSKFKIQKPALQENEGLMDKSNQTKVTWYNRNTFQQLLSDILIYELNTQLQQFEMAVLDVWMC